MKQIKYLIFALLCISFVACNDDDNNNENDVESLELTLEYFNQSAWEASYIIIYTDENGDIGRDRYKSTFLFSTDSTGDFSMVLPEEERPIGTSFSYSVDGKKLNISNSNLNGYRIKGDWWVVTKSVDKLHLTSHPQGHIRYSIDMYLTRTY